MEHIRGATFNKLCSYKNSNNVPQDITNVAIKSQVRTMTGGMLSELTVNKIDATQGKFVLTADTSAWPSETIVMDIQYTANGVITMTNKIKINVQEQVTR